MKVNIKKNCKRFECECGNVFMSNEFTEKITKKRGWQELMSEIDSCRECGIYTSRNRYSKNKRVWYETVREIDSAN